MELNIFRSELLIEHYGSTYLQKPSERKLHTLRTELSNGPSARSVDLPLGKVTSHNPALQWKISQTFAESQIKEIDFVI